MAGYLAGDVDEWLYIDIADQHPDSIRFIRDCEAAIGQEIQILRSKEYSCVEDCVKVFGGFRAPQWICTMYKLAEKASTKRMGIGTSKI